MKHLYIFLFILSSIPVLGAPLTPEAALQRLLTQNRSQIRGDVEVPKFSIRKILNDSCGNNTVYLFDSESGFVVASADDAFPALLGYGEGQLYDLSGNLPIGFNDWLQYMGKLVSETAREGNSVTISPSVGEAIAPLCKTTWGQHEPYNLECPEYNGEKCLSGCVATAMAQVMKYHNWPPQGKGELTYHADKINIDIYTDFSQYTLDWGNMLNDYSTQSATEQQKQAVAHLMRGVGGSAEMDYFPTASGADIIWGGVGLLNNWDYSEDIRYVRRDWYSIRDWSHLLYESLKNYGPIVYAGFSFYSGHAFVCDGYDGEGLFHFNWGWDGTANGYFAIDFLNPVVTDEPWKTGYNGGQCALLNIRPRSPENPGTPTYTLWLNAYYVNPATGYGQEASHILHPGDSFKMTGECSNYGPFVIPAGSKFATLFTSYYTGAIFPSNVVELTSDFDFCSNYDSSMKTVPSGLADGLYSLTNDFYISPSGWGHCIPMPGSPGYSAIVENDGSDIRFIETMCIPELEEADIPDILYLQSSTSFHATLTNSKPRDLERPVRAELIKNGEVKGWSPWVQAAFGPEETIDFELIVDKWTWKEEGIPHAGEYLLCLSMNNPYGGIWIPMGKGKRVRVSDSAGIDAITTDNEYQDAMFDLQGRKVTTDVNMLPPGIYIKRSNGITTKIILPMK